VGGKPLPGSRKNPVGHPGSGREFLQFHRSLLDEFFAWNVVHRAVDPENSMKSSKGRPAILREPYSLT
jgi:hypothetical protein